MASQVGYLLDPLYKDVRGVITEIVWMINQHIAAAPVHLYHKHHGQHWLQYDMTHIIVRSHFVRV